MIGLLNEEFSAGQSWKLLLLPSPFKGRPDRSRSKRPEKRFTPCKGNQKTQRAVVALSGLSDLQTHMLQLKRGGRDKRGQRIRRLAGGPLRLPHRQRRRQPDSATIPWQNRSSRRWSCSAEAGHSCPEPAFGSNMIGSDKRQTSHSSNAWTRPWRNAKNRFLPRRDDPQEHDSPPLSPIAIRQVMNESNWASKRYHGQKPPRFFLACHATNHHHKSTARWQLMQREYSENLSQNPVVPWIAPGVIGFGIGFQSKTN